MHEIDEGTAFRREMLAEPIPNLVYGWSPKIPSMLPPPTLYTNIDREDFIVGTVTNDQRRLTKGDIRRFNAVLQHIINRAVTVDGCAYRFNRDGITLYGVDSEGQTTNDCITIDARRNGGGDQVHDVRDWYARAVVQAQPPSEPVNGQRLEDRSMGQEFIDAHSVHSSEPGDDGWQVYVNAGGEQDARFEKRAGGYRCTRCAEGEEPFVTTNARALATHWRMKHERPALIDAPETRDKASETRRSNRYARDMELAIELLTGSLGKQPPTEEVEQLRVENADLKAKLTLLREALEA